MISFPINDANITQLQSILSLYNTLINFFNYNYFLIQTKLLLIEYITYVSKFKTKIRSFENVEVIKK